MNTFQSIASVASSFLYILARRKPGQSLKSAFGLEPTHVKSKAIAPYRPKANDASEKNSGPANGHANGSPLTHPTPLEVAAMRKALLYRCFQCALFITAASPFGFAALNHVSYPAMTLAKACKLVPVMVMNVLLYRRKFALHKYLVVAMVTGGIAMFFGLGKKNIRKATKEPSGSSLIGVTYLLINLAIDGATNSTQDEIFDKYSVTGQQLMFWINLMATIITTVLSILPLPYIPDLHPTYGWQSEISIVRAFIKIHPGVISALVKFAVTGSLGQLFIFETLQHFGSLTLVYVKLCSLGVRSS